MANSSCSSTIIGLLSPTAILTNAGHDSWVFCVYLEYAVVGSSIPIFRLQLNYNDIIRKSIMHNLEIGSFILSSF
jgi:hypothetical protein